MFHTIADFGRIGEENAFAVLARATELAGEGKDIINLGIGQPDFRTPEHIVEAAVKALRDGHHGYTPATGIKPLREAVAADIHRRTGVEVSPDLVIIVPGGKVTMFAAILMFGEPGADILYPDPGFPIYRSMIEFTGANPVPVPIREENGFAFSAEETLKLITPKTRQLLGPDGKTGWKGAPGHTGRFTNCVVLIFTTAGPLPSTRGIKSGSARRLAACAGNKKTHKLKTTSIRGYRTHKIMDALPPKRQSCPRSWPESRRAR